MEIENRALMKHQNEGVGFESRCSYIGLSPEGWHRRVRHFPHAKFSLSEPSSLFTIAPQTNSLQVAIPLLGRPNRASFTFSSKLSKKVILWVAAARPTLPIAINPCILLVILIYYFEANLAATVLI
jgi:hypothetical protein